MKTHIVLSSDFPEIDDAVKACVNLGQWLLFKSNSDGEEGHDAVLYLKADAQIFELDSRGKVVKCLPGNEVSVHIDELLYFSDMPQPRSLSNVSSSKLFAHH